MADNNSSGVEYRINFINNSMNPGSFMIFQQYPELNTPDSYSLAWFTKYLYPSTLGSFSWEPAYDFAWMEQKAINARMKSVTSQCIPASLTEYNTALLTYDSGYNFVIQPDNGPEGTLYIKTDNTIPANQLGIGLGMAGAPTFLMPAQPDSNLALNPHPEYWVAFGDYEQGEILNVKEMTNSALVQFLEGVSAINVTLNPDNTWTVQPA
ncbi:hypothetical protein [Fluviicola sp.]|uniref:hypothetical protein n=1 Tax=Fluviicola sp. TaxID=1917219 RepID=UPI0031D14462